MVKNYPKQTVLLNGALQFATNASAPNSRTLVSFSHATNTASSTSTLPKLKCKEPPERNFTPTFKSNQQPQPTHADWTSKPPRLAATSARTRPSPLKEQSLLMRLMSLTDAKARACARMVDTLLPSNTLLNSKTQSTALISIVYVKLLKKMLTSLLTAAPAVLTE